MSFAFSYSPDHAEIPPLLIVGAIAFVVSVLLTLAVRSLASRWQVVDAPDATRRLHARPVPLLGGLAIFLAVALVTWFALDRDFGLTSGLITWKHYLGILIGAGILQIGGALDDVKRWPAKYTFFFPVLAGIAALAGGLEVGKLTNPLGGMIAISGIFSMVGVFMWLMFMVYTTKLLDGVDGLSTSVGSVATLMILCLTLTTTYFQPDVALFASIILAAFLGFLMFNAPKASIFLGEGGSTLIGFLVGVLAIISGSKVAIALLVLGIPLLDMVWVIVRRWSGGAGSGSAGEEGGWKRVLIGDRTHLHYRLLDQGWNPRQVVLFQTAASALLGIGALVLQSREKVLLLLVLVASMAILTTILSLKEDGEKKL
ncbi:undecaprenyl/decaprenyl-phosphate alpha-N-acetylglucosaminyl 1-phosphate transferase [Candidatus Uhrbacteria bacterium]|nr:undecaprenyl/decaprenyl-phosphate alpha-N-acetylglucosaminyl 1-phosphate transferase [Candidatus Uhrbacteria bacterium]